MFFCCRECAERALNDLKTFLVEENGQAAVSWGTFHVLPSPTTPSFLMQIYDATNTTVERRTLIVNYLKGVENVQVSIAFFTSSLGPLSLLRKYRMRGMSVFPTLHLLRCLCQQLLPHPNSLSLPLPRLFPHPSFCMVEVPLVC
jgi:hypothetical protein